MPLKNWKLTFILGIALMVFSYLYLDRPLALYFQDLNPSTRQVVKLIGQIALPIPHVLLWVVVYYILRFRLKLIPMARKAILFAISINIANVITTILKNGIGRSRPEIFLSQKIYTFKMLSFPLSNLYVSFPSSHAATICALTAGLACFYPRFSSLFLLLGFLIGFCRVVIDVHYLSDVIGGMLIGVLVANSVYLAMRKEVKFD